jgi:outer membrane protein assembly factor BamA
MKHERFSTAAAPIAAALVIAVIAPLCAATGGGVPAGPILSISVFGNDRTRNAIIVHKLGLRPGDPFSEEAVERGLREIETLSGIESARYRTIRNEGEEGVRLLVVVTEADTRSIIPLIQRSLTNDLAFGLAFRETNLLGRDQALCASALFRGATVLEGSWRAPALFGTPLLGTGVSFRYRRYRYPYPDWERSLVDAGISWLEAAASLCVHPVPFVSLSISPGFDRIGLADSMLAGQGESGVPPAPSGTFSTLETAIAIDLLDREFYPRNGGRFEAARKDWGLLQDEAEMKNVLYRFHGTLCLDFGRALLSFDSWGTFVRGRTPITLIQHAGGEESIRGYDFGVLSGSNRLVGRTEVRLPLNFDDLNDLGNPMILVDFHLFLDSGACWSEPQRLESESFHSGFGCGMNFIPVENRLLKVGYAWRRETSGRWYFDVGTMF